MPIYSGTEGNASIDGELYYFKEWRLDIEASEIDITNFQSPSGYREYLPGFKSGKVTAKGFHDPDITLPSLAAPVPVVLTIGGASTITGDVVVTKLGFGQNIENASEFDFEGRLDGPPTFN